MAPRVAILKSRADLRGGLEKYTKRLIKAFVDKGCETFLLTTGQGIDIPGAQTVCLSNAPLPSRYNVLHFNNLCKKWVEQNRVDIIFGMERTTSHTHYRAGNGVHAAYLHRRKETDPFYKTLFNAISPFHKTLLKLEREAFCNTELKLLFANSEMVRSEIIQNYPLAQDKIVVVHNGVEWKSWEGAFESSLTQEKNSFHFLFVGNGYRRKGLTYLLEGLAKIKQEDFVLTVVGKDKNIPYFAGYAHSLGLGKKVRFLGSQPDMLPFYMASDALVIPSLYDPFANVTVEALAMGLFVITSAYNGGKEVIKPFSGICLNELGSVQEMARVLQCALAVRKTTPSARKIRQSVEGLDFSSQLDKIVHKTLAH